MYKIRQNSSFTEKTNEIRRAYWRPGPNTGGRFYFLYGFVWIQGECQLPTTTACIPSPCPCCPLSPASLPDRHDGACPHQHVRWPRCGGAWQLCADVPVPVLYPGRVSNTHVGGTETFPLPLCGTGLQLGKGDRFESLREVGDIGGDEQPAKLCSLDHQARQAGEGFCAQFTAEVRSSCLWGVLEAERLGENECGKWVGLSGVPQHSGLEEAPGEVPEPAALQGRRVDGAPSTPEVKPMAAACLPRPHSPDTRLSYGLIGEVLPGH